MKPMKYVSLFLMLSVMWGAHFGMAQITIDFSSEQGFSDGPLHRQSGAGEDRWNENQPGSFMVDAANGVVTFDSSAGNWNNAVFARGLAVGDAYVFVIDFRLTAGTPSPPRGNALLSRFELVGEDGSAFGIIRQRGGRANFFDLQVANNLPEGRSTQQSDGFSGELIGLKVNRRGTAYTEATSNKLRLVIVHRRTGEENTVESAVMLRDVASNEVIHGVVHRWEATEAWLKEEGKRFRMNTGNMNQSLGDNGATSISIDRIQIGVGMS